MIGFILLVMSLIMFAGWVFGTCPWWWCLLPYGIPILIFLVIKVFMAAAKVFKNSTDGGGFWMP